VLVFPHHCQHEQSAPGILCQLMRPCSISQLRSALLTCMAAPLQIARNREDYFELLIRLLRPTVAARRRLLALRGKVGHPALSLGIGLSIRLISNLKFLDVRWRQHCPEEIVVCSVAVWSSAPRRARQVAGERLRSPLFKPWYLARGMERTATALWDLFRSGGDRTVAPGSRGQKPHSFRMCIFARAFLLRAHSADADRGRGFLQATHHVSLASDPSLLLLEETHS